MTQLLRQMAFAVTVLILVLLAFFSSSGSLARSWLPLWATTPTTIASLGPTVAHLESLSQLVSTKVSLADVLTAEGEGFRGSWLIKGDALMVIDLNKARILEVDKGSRKAQIWLPSPQVVSARVDHERSRTWSFEKTTWIPFAGNPDALRDRAMVNAQRLIEHAAASKANQEHAKTSAAGVIENLYRMVDWHVTVQWGDVAE